MKKLNFVGIGGALAVELGGNCAYLKNNGTLFVIDACEDLTLKLKNESIFDGVSQIVIAITHTHADHVAGLGTFLWYSNFVLGLKPKIIINSFKFKRRIDKLMKIIGVSKKYYEFVKDSQVLVDSATVKMIRTRHNDKLECFGIMFEDDAGKYYYSGDTRDFEFIKTLSQDEKVKIIYLEVANESYDAHIEYLKVKELDKSKLILMHFDDVNLYAQAQKDGFICASVDN